jgi:hypothetical protein
MGAAATGNANQRRFARMDCDQLAAEIVNARRQMINPMTIAYQRGYLRDAEAAAAEKDCPVV